MSSQHQHEESKKRKDRTEEQERKNALMLQMDAIIRKHIPDIKQATAGMKAAAEHIETLHEAMQRELAGAAGEDYDELCGIMQALLFTDEDDDIDGLGKVKEVAERALDAIADLETADE